MNRLRRGLRVIAPALALCALLPVVATAAATNRAPERPARPRQGALRIIPPDERPPDLILLTIDALRPDRLPFGGSTLNTAPFLDSLAAQAILFTEARSVSSWTVPALASLHTGLYPVSHGVTHGSIQSGGVQNQEVLPAAQPTLAELLRRRGYRTLAVVANTHLTPGGGFERGFDRFVCVDFANADVVNDTLRALRGLIEDRSQPLFLWIHYFDPHHPYAARQPWLGQLHPEIPPGEVQFGTSVMGQWNSLPLMARQHMGRLMTVARGFYDSDIRAMDERIRAIWRDLPRLDEGLLVFTADHGEEFQEHRQMTHGHNLYDTTVRIPLFIRPPRGGRPDTVRQVVSLVDVPATLLPAADVRTPSNWAGLPLAEKGRPAPLPADRSVLAELERIPKQALMKAWIGPRWKLIQDVKARISELYDLEADPEERRNVAGEEPERAAATLDALKRHLATLPVAPPPGPATRRAMSPELLQMLKSLGYLN